MLNGDDFCVQLLNSPQALLSTLEGFSPNHSFQQEQDALDLLKGQEGSTAGGCSPCKRGCRARVWGGMGWEMLCEMGGELLLRRLGSNSPGKGLAHVGRKRAGQLSQGEELEQYRDEELPCCRCARASWGTWTLPWKDGLYPGRSCRDS